MTILTPDGQPSKPVVQDREVRALVDAARANLEELLDARPVPPEHEGKAGTRASAVVIVVVADGQVHLAPASTAGIVHHDVARMLNEAMAQCLDEHTRLTGEYAKKARASAFQQALKGARPPR